MVSMASTNLGCQASNISTQSATIHGPIAQTLCISRSWITTICCGASRSSNPMFKAPFRFSFTNDDYWWQLSHEELADEVEDYHSCWSSSSLNIMTFLNHSHSLLTFNHARSCVSRCFNLPLDTSSQDYKKCLHDHVMFKPRGRRKWIILGLSPGFPEATHNNWQDLHRCVFHISTF